MQVAIKDFDLKYGHNLCFLCVRSVCGLWYIGMWYW